MKELKEPCKSCLGCSRLENPEFTGDKECEYGIRPRFLYDEKNRKI